MLLHKSYRLTVVYMKTQKKSTLPIEGYLCSGVRSPVTSCLDITG
nr:hypothetical protein [Hassalia byssoidea]